MDKVSTIGLDIAKSVFQVHGVDAAGVVLIRTFLLEMDSRLAGAALTLPMSRHDIADYLGLTLETVSRALSIATIENPHARR